VSDAPQPVFREAMHPDLDALVRMMRNLALQPPSLPFDEGLVRKAFSEFLAHPEFGRAWMIVVDGKPAGYVILTIGFSFEFHGREGFIDELYVEPEYRRKGLGRKAMTFAADSARRLGVNALHLEVDHQNEGAQALYRGLGFADHGRFLMTKWLTGKGAAV
jgi:ribosomal protein S18 acetylase RimI-like enzyme